MEKILIIDTETTNTLDDALVYDISYMVADFNGNIYHKDSYTVSDIFLWKEMMKEAYFADKIPMYWEDIKNGSRKLRRFTTIKFILRDVMEQYNITKVFAFNCRFDALALGTTQKYITSSKYRYFFKYGTQFHDILKLARNTFKNDEEYHRFCIDNNYLTKYGKDRHTAEIVYRYLFNNDFVESHTALEDCEIEYQILLSCLEKNGNCDTLLW